MLWFKWLNSYRRSSAKIAINESSYHCRHMTVPPIMRQSVPCPLDPELALRLVLINKICRSDCCASSGPTRSEAWQLLLSGIQAPGKEVQAILLNGRPRGERPWKQLTMWQERTQGEPGLPSWQPARQHEGLRQTHEATLDLPALPSHQVNTGVSPTHTTCSRQSSSITSLTTGHDH